MDTAIKAGHTTGPISRVEYEETVRSVNKPAYIPIYVEIPKPVLDPATIYASLPPGEGFLLESMEGVPKRAVRSIIGTGPLATLAIAESLSGAGKSAQVFQNVALQGRQNKSPTEIMQEIISGISAISPDGRTFTGGMAGYCRYDLAADITRGMVQAGKEDGPVIRLIVPGELIIFDHASHSCMLIAGTLVEEGDDLQEKYEDAVKKIKRLQNFVSTAPLHTVTFPLRTETPLLPDHDRDSYERAVEQALLHIRAGDIFQVVLSRRFSIPYAGNPFKIYQVLREINPSPYLYYFDFGDEAIIGSSPEMLVKTEGRTITTVPIAGTRPRGKTEEEDAQLAEDLLADPKERAEHLMLVDLARNDIGRVAKFGTVRVSDFMGIDKFSHVQHITSVVTGEMEEDKSPVDALIACFPAGTVSGAPKIRAMQIIGELEPVPRGLYAGAVGYLGFDGLMEFAIAIRTVIVKDKIATCQAGAGIVADSVPSREFDETQAKAGAMAQAIYAAGGLV